MDKMIYERQIDGDVKEAKRIEFDVTSDLDIVDFRIICIRLALALGYHPDSVKKSFGEIDDALTDRKQLELLLD